MKKLRSLTGGYRRSQSYLLDIQAELHALGNSILGTISFDVVLSGCAVTDNFDGTVNITAGLVYVGGEVRRFDAVTHILHDGTKVITIGTAVTSGPEPFANPPGSVQDVYTETKAVVGNFVPGADRQLVIGLSLLTFETYIDLRIAGSAQKGQIREFVFDTTPDEVAFLAKFDLTGQGITPETLDWELMNNPATVDGQGRVLVGVGTVIDSAGQAQSFANNEQGGLLKVGLVTEEMPPHTHSQEWISASGGASGSGGNLVDGHQPTGPAGGDPALGGAVRPHKNVQPYLGVYRIRRVR